MVLKLSLINSFAQVRLNGEFLMVLLFFFLTVLMEMVLNIHLAEQKDTYSSVTKMITYQLMASFGMIDKQTLT